ncbi:NUDIX hydrolase [Stenotrophomonas sp. MMGLT7]|uniref:NUDIX hydrolase n=1 Tax=Stenotrophomonas sp. MMGLT7 TaxID=2901227 RepID=UPI001E35458B|nr:NUDIX hydrolase [Stenotrophomonas sp. MMGLT7]MCD7099698.1 NUDIX hydrolase [Stenotrophomonas sp. MMGLT7]
MKPVVNERGERLVSILRIGEAAAASFPIAFALIIGFAKPGYLLVHDTRRRIWELPGGFLDPGESARQAALRELQEESGQIAVLPRWEALLELEFPGNGVAHSTYGALFSATIRAPRRFDTNAEIDAIGFWPRCSLPADVSAIDRSLLDHFPASEDAPPVR